MLRDFAAISLVLVVPPLSASDTAALSERIDRHLAKSQSAAKVVPAAISDDSEFLRRVHLDLVGCIPTVARAREFLDDTSPDKRGREIERLLRSPNHARHWGLFWRRTWLPQIEGTKPSKLCEEFDDWLRERLRANERYDRLVVAQLIGSDDSPARLFQESHRRVPDAIAASATRVFLGVNLDCAQCHNHPFAAWKRDQFWQTAAFFVRPRAGNTPAERLAIAIPDTNRSVEPTAIAGESVRWPEVWNKLAGKRAFSDWATSPSNPYFARNAANRVWAQLFGLALVEPLDELGGDAEPVHAELLDDLARSFSRSGFDLRELISAICRSEAYQRSSRWPKGRPVPPEPLFARAAVRGLSGEQMFDSLLLAAGNSNRVDKNRDFDARKEFLDRYREDRPAFAPHSIGRALLAMNGSLVGKATTVESSRTLKAAIEAPFLTHAEKVDSLYLATLGRFPSGEERKALSASLRDENSEALADLFWALLNSAEFGTNH